MNYQFSSKVAELIQRELSAGQYATEEEVLVEALERLAWEREELRAIESACNALEEGAEIISIEAAFAELRAKHNIPAPQ